ncbi:MAG: ferredoxin [Chitinophagaceae bacterium]
MGYAIKFTGHYEDKSYSLESNENEYRNLMSLLKDKICPEDFGQCGGMGRCGTCLIKLSGVSRDALLSYRNEDETLRKMGIVDPAVRLSCQIQINEDLKNVIVQLLDNN